MAGAELELTLTNLWTPFSVYAGPANGQTQFQLGSLGVANLPFFGASESPSDDNPVTEQYVMAFVVDENTSKVITNVPLICNQTSEGLSAARSGPVVVGFSGGEVSAMVASSQWRYQVGSDRAGGPQPM